ncbi:MAG: LicD family protein [Chloroflexota bacterium]|nr:LicD family protein [Chloroflexota bacterium]
MGNADDAAYMETVLSPKPLDPEKAAERLREVKGVFDELGVTFWLRSGTLLGIVRAGSFIDWDDEMDTASVLGMHGVTKETVKRVAEAFRARGFTVRVQEGPRYAAVAFVKDGIRTDWTCYRLVDGRAYEFPGIEIPLHVFDELKEIEFAGERFLIPNPPEDYLAAKYGPDWRTPKGPGFEADVVRQVTDGSMISRWTGLLWRASGGRLPRWCARVRVYDREGALVRGVQVRVAGIGETATNAQGEARFPVPADDYYAVTVAYPGHSEVLYMEMLRPGGRYTYWPGPIVTAEEHYKAGVRALALIEE